MTPDLLVSGGIVAALEQAAVAVGRRVDLFRLAAHLHGLPLGSVPTCYWLRDRWPPHLEPRLSECAIGAEPFQPTLACRAKPRQARAGGPNGGETGDCPSDPLSLTSGRLRRLQTL